MATGKPDERADAKAEQLIPPDETPVIRAIAMPADTNPAGDIFGGWLMSQMDLAAGSVATRRARARCATVTVEGMTFLSPVYVGDEVSLYARLLSEGRTSMRNQGGSLAPLPRGRGGEQGDGGHFHFRRPRQGSSPGASAANPCGRPGQIAAPGLRSRRMFPASRDCKRLRQRPEAAGQASTKLGPGEKICEFHPGFDRSLENGQHPPPPIFFCGRPGRRLPRRIDSFGWRTKASPSRIDEP